MRRPPGFCFIDERAAGPCRVDSSATLAGAPAAAGAGADAGAAPGAGAGSGQSSSSCTDAIATCSLVTGVVTIGVGSGVAVGSGSGSATATGSAGVGSGSAGSGSGGAWCEGTGVSAGGGADDGAALALLGQPAERRDPGLSVAAREAVLAAIAGDAATSEPGPRGAAAALRASLGHTAVLTAGERHLLAELLDRIADDAPRT